MKDKDFKINSKPMNNFWLARFLIFILIIFISFALVLFGINVKSIVKEHVIMLGYGAFGQSTSHKNALFTYFSKKLDFNEILEIPLITIDIQDKDFNKIIQKRKQALISGILIKTADDTVPGKILHNNEEFDISIRLKGDWTEHLEHEDKWSFRIQLDDDLFLGMEEFSIQHPKQREFQSEPLFYSMLSDFGVITPRHFFVSVVINNHNIGIMALEEHFSEEILQNNNRPEGVIFKYSEDLLWPSRVNESSVLYENFYNNDIVPFDKKTVFNDSNLLEQFFTGKKLLRSLKEPNTKPSEIFDADKMGKYLAIIDIWGARHALFWHNLRFYLNPKTGKLEPIAFDASMSYRENHEDRSVEKEEFSRILMGDKLIYEVYLKTLGEVENYLNTSVSIYDLNEKLYSELTNEFYYVPKFDIESLKYRLYNVRLDTVKDMKYISDYDNEYVDLIKSSLFASEEFSNIIQLENISPFTISIINITDELGNELGFDYKGESIISGRGLKTINLNYKYPLDKIHLEYRIINESFTMQEELVRF